MSDPRAIAERLRDIRDQLGEIASEAGHDEARVFLDALEVLAESATSIFDPERGAAATAASDGDLVGSLARSLQIARHSIEDAPFGIFRVNSAGQIVSANDAACRSLGYDRTELEKLTIFDVDPNLDPIRWKDHRVRTKAGGGVRTFESQHRRRDGTVFPVEISVRQFEYQGELFSLSFSKDITERRQAEEERKQLEARMVEAQRLESLGLLACGIAHDFNNLLMVILGNLGLARDDLRGAVEVNRMLDDANRAAQHGADLCRQLLTYAGRTTSETQPVEFVALLREQAEMLVVSAAKSTRLVLDLPDQLPILQGDVTQLRQVIMNLIINASEALGGAPGVITLRARGTHCVSDDLETRDLCEELAPGPYVLVEVSDSGAGMDAETAARIFDPFFTTKSAGRGLGLAAVRGIVKGHGGAIRVTSEPGEGSTFELLLPVPKTLTHRSAPPTQSRAWQGRGLVLLVDDEGLIRDLGQRMLERLGFDVVAAGAGNDAVRVLEQHRDRVRFAVLDWTMPDMGGRETFTQLRRIRSDLGIVLTSGNAPEDVLRWVEGERATAFVGKPYDLDELAAALQLVESLADR